MLNKLKGKHAGADSCGSRITAKAGTIVTNKTADLVALSYMPGLARNYGRSRD